MGAGPQASQPVVTPQPFEWRGRGGLRLRGEARGDPAGSPVILLHGGGQTRHAWGGTAEALARAGCWAVTLDQRGHGDSEWAPDGDYDLEAFAADLAGVARALGVRPAVIGASLGGLAALLAEGESEQPLLGALVMVDVAPRLELQGVLRIVGFMMAHPDGFASVEEAADAVAGYLSHRPRPRDTRGLEKNLRLGGDGRWRWHWDPRFLDRRGRGDRSLSDDRLARAARRLRVPTLLVRGRLSDVLSEAAAREFLEMVPHDEYADVAQAAHMVAGDRNDVFTDAVLRFLTRVV
jgi:pimeloyl-ACP methyl ester carboxylesterase